MQKPSDTTDDMATGFAGFADRVLRGRTNKAILNSSVALSALDIGVPSGAGEVPFDIPAMLINNQLAYNFGNWGSGLFAGNHPLFDFNADNFTLFGLNFPDFMGQFRGDEVSKHLVPIYDGVQGQSLAESIGLPDLPYGEMAHLAHMGMALYDTGRTFQDVWKQLGDYYEKNNTSPQQQGLSIAAHMGKTITHPEMLHTLAARGTMLTVMGLLHPLGALVSIGVAYLCAHLVHSFFGLAERNKEAIQRIEEAPVLGAIYSASGIKEWAERDSVPAAPETQADVIDPYAETEMLPEKSVSHPNEQGRIHPLIAPQQLQFA